MNLLHKTFAAPAVKVLDADQGVIEAVVSVFNNVDAVKERVRPGFFKESIARKLPKGVWMHDWNSPVAKTLEAKELMPGDSALPLEIRDNGGLYIKGQFNLETQRGREAFSDLKFGAVDEFSFGYLVEESETNKESGVRDLIKGTIYEWSPVLLGCNPATALISAKDGMLADITRVKESAKTVNVHIGTLNETGDLARLLDAANKVGDGGGDAPAEFKAQYLGAWVETSMTMAALQRLDEALWFNVLYNEISDSERPLADRLAVMRAAFDEFRDIALAAVEALLTATDAAGQMEQAAAVKALWRDPDDNDPDTKAFDGGLADDLPLSEFSDAVVDAAEEMARRFKRRLDMRAKAGRVLSEANITKIQGAVDALTQVLAAAQPAPTDEGEKQADEPAVAASALRSQSLRLQSLFAF